jgi:hypothetical protein
MCEVIKLFDEKRIQLKTIDLLSLSNLDSKFKLKLHTSNFQRSKTDLKYKRPINQSYFFVKKNKEETKKEQTYHTSKNVSICTSELTRPKLESFKTSLMNNSRNMRSRLMSTNSLVKTQRTIKPVLYAVKDAESIERENINPYFWYYKNTECLRDSCKLGENHPRQIRFSRRKTDIKSILKNSESKGVIDLSSYAFSEFKKFYPTINEKDKNLILKSKKMSEQCQNYYKNSQELLNSRYFVKIEKPNTSSLLQSPKETVKEIKNVENSKVSNVKKFKSTLPRARLKMLNIDNRYLKDAEEMSFNPESNSFAYYDFYDYYD